MSAGVGPGMQTGQQFVGALDSAGQPAMSRHNEVIKEAQQQLADSNEQPALAEC